MTEKLQSHMAASEGRLGAVKRQLESEANTYEQKCLKKENKEHFENTEAVIKKVKNEAVNVIVKKQEELKNFESECLEVNISKKMLLHNILRMPKKK